MSREPPLVGVPNFSEGRNERVMDALEATLAAHARILDRHHDTEHNRSVFTLAAPPDAMVAALVSGAAHAVELIDLREHQGLHPHVGAIDVAPVVWQTPELHDEAVAGALRVAEGIAELGVPVFLYGELASDPERVERAYFRRGGPAELARRMGSGELAPDHGPSEPHPTAGAALVTAREPLVAFNLELDTSNPEVAREIAAELREADGGLTGVRALGLPREGGRAQVSMNIHDPQEVPLARVVEEAARVAERHGVRLVEAELVGLLPEVAIAGYPGDPPIRDFDPNRDVIENVLG